MTDRTNDAGQADRADQAEHADQVDRTDRADRADHSGEARDRTTGQAERSGSARDRTADQAVQEPDATAEQALTPAQTVGPFYGFALPYAGGPVVVEGGDLRVHGTVFDGAGDPVPDALVEVLQADAEGRLGGGPHGGLFGRCSTAPEGRFAFTTVLPGEAGDGCAPHLAVIVHARGLLLHLHTRLYFPDHARNVSDPVLAKVPDERRHTLIAVPDEDGFRFDIRLQGEHETVFFDV
ncbi:protocatechuate 3,4-dioxygenase, alpha subunit [Glycomyces sambucus]|uniref:Protocatechuate 3,4-dioxygenase, alpha subunit n=1 Tax=Glycomyces sambucus TaxID=380244 RepID=A0A1G9LV05_9ACTN|nr:protocatechuate 3,4-dioxygenase subunit alpha [Glycomyces sambucus]SDL65778.1 protocatechuate 3,4-dioxygenase, alpha subunit [Glycomyces sambucus]